MIALPISDSNEFPDGNYFAEELRTFLANEAGARQPLLLTNLPPDISPFFHLPGLAQGGRDFQDFGDPGAAGAGVVLGRVVRGQGRG